MKKMGIEKEESYGYEYLTKYTNSGNIGVNYKTKNGVYLIDCEYVSAEFKNDDGKYNMIVRPEFITDVNEYHVTDNAYGISEPKLTNLLNKHAVDRPLAISLAPNSKQYIISYLYERIPECFYFMDDILSLIDRCHELDNKKIYANMSAKLKSYSDMIQYKVYGGSNDTTKSNCDCSKNHLMCFDNNNTKNSKYEINLRLIIFIDIIYKFINNESDATICNDSKYLNKYHIYK